jgi:dipeptidyl aminopeptidase/acylaminoacyl peptidase
LTIATNLGVPLRLPVVKPGIIHGTRDDMAPISQAEELNDALTKAGATVQFFRLGSDHMFHEPAAHRRLALETQAFFDRYLASAH